MTKLIQVPLAELLQQSDAGLHYGDMRLLARLAASVKAFGQLRPLVVAKNTDGSWRLLDGRKLAAAMVDAGFKRAAALDLGEVSEETAAMLQLALLTLFVPAYGRVALQVHDLCETHGRTEQEVASASPFSLERISYFRKLAHFDWSEFDEKPEDQHALDWTADGDAAVDPELLAMLSREVPAEEPPQEPAPAPVVTTVAPVVAQESLF